MDITQSLDLYSVTRHTPFLRRVNRARLRDGRAVAIKTTAPLSSEKLPKLLDFWPECRHPNIVQLIGKATFRGYLAAIYEWHEYRSVLRYLESHPTADPYHLSAQICDGLAYLHANDIVHGRVRGDKILVSGDGVPRIRLSLDTSTRATDSVHDWGYSRWDAPEIHEGSKFTFASDVYSLGMTILEAITRDKPYREDRDTVSVDEKIRRGELPQRPTEYILENNAGHVIWELLCKCWSLSPGQRPSAGYIFEMIQMVYQSPAGVAPKAVKLVVTEQTSVHDLVAHYERQGLPNYTDVLEKANIVTLSPFADTALANVYKIDLSNGQSVAVKCVKHTTPHKKLKRAARELSCWLSYKNDNILPVLGFGVVKGELAMVSPWMRNGHVTEYLGRNPSCDRLALCAQLSRAIAYLHSQDVVHGDIKGANVLVSDVGAVQVMDFGVSVADHQEIEFSVTLTSGGTQRWLAPEILLGQTDSTREADVYALGMTMIEIYTGEQPYGSTSWFQLQHSVIYGHLRPSRPIRMPIDDIGNGIWGLINCCWMANPAERLTSAVVLDWLEYYTTLSTQTGV